MDKISKLRRAKGERVYEITSISRILSNAKLMEMTPAGSFYICQKDITVLAMRCAAAAKTARRKHFERILKGKLVDNGK